MIDLSLTSGLEENLGSVPEKDLLLLPVPYPELLLERGGEKLRSYLPTSTLVISL